MNRVSRSISMAVLSITLVTISSAVHAGAPIGGGRFLIENVAALPETESAVAYNPQRGEYLVVWRAAEIWGRRVSRHGTLLGSAFRISPEGEGVRPDVSYNSATDEYLIVWHNLLGIRGQRISALGARLGGLLNIAPGIPASHYYSQPAVDYASTSDRYLVVYRYLRVSDNSSGIWAQVVTSSGTLDGSAHQVSQQSSSMMPEQPDVAYNRSRNEFLIVWQQTMGSDIDVYGRRFKLAGGAAPLGPELLVAIYLNADETAAAVAAIPTVPNEGGYLVAWEEDTGTDYNIIARTVSWDGVLGAQRNLAVTPWGEYSPAVAGSESNRQFLVTWTWIPVIAPPALMQVRARALAVDGTVLHDTVLVGGEQVFESAVAAGPTGDFLITFDDNEALDNPNRGIYGRLWGSRVYLPLVVRQ
ncbi:MAG: hypothetical protein R6U12_11765 [Thioalkalivibrio sp.]